MSRKEKLIESFVLKENLSKQKFELAKTILILIRHIGYVDYAVLVLKLRYDEEIAQEVRDLGYTVPSFNDSHYQKSLDAITALDADRVNELSRLLNEYNS